MLFKQLFIIFMFSFLGEFIARLMPFSVPGSVIGMVCLFIALHKKWVKIEQVDHVGSFLTDNMAMFFVPAGVGLLTNMGVIQDLWWKLVVIVLVSVVLTMGFSGLVIEWMNRSKSSQSAVSESGQEETHV